MKDDLISRQAAINALERRKDKTAKGEIGSFYNTIIQHDIDVIVELPPAQPDVPDTNVGNMISRQDAIDALGERPLVWTSDDDYALGERNQYDIDRLAVETVPSVDAVEVVRCKDCKHSTEWYRDRRRCFLWCKDGIDVFEDGYCSYWERKNDD